ncbi:hypothetical protein LZ31DRAFT_350211 [Colletotrichum somersetense]|nr:hypothetical protein LZ31DRAFT_350211 [Colletotrichum somersetense]
MSPFDPFSRLVLLSTASPTYLTRAMGPTWGYTDGEEGCHAQKPQLYRVHFPHGGRGGGIKKIEWHMGRTKMSFFPRQTNQNCRACLDSASSPYPLHSAAASLPWPFFVNRSSRLPFCLPPSPLLSHFTRQIPAFLPVSFPLNLSSRRGVAFQIRPSPTPYLVYTRTLQRPVRADQPKKILRHPRP